MPCEALKARSRVGRTVQVHVRAAVRPNQAACRRKRQFLGTCSKPQSPSACGTQGAVPASVAVLWVLGDLGPQDRVLRKDTHAVYGQGARLPRVRTWRRGRGETLKRSARPFGGDEGQEDRLVSGRIKNRGDDA